MELFQEEDKESQLNPDDETVSSGATTATPKSYRLQASTVDLVVKPVSASRLVLFARPLPLRSGKGLASQTTSRFHH